MNVNDIAVHIGCHNAAMLVSISLEITLHHCSHSGLAQTHAHTHTDFQMIILVLYVYNRKKYFKKPNIIRDTLLQLTHEKH